MRPLWKGAISFGLVNIPVKMYAATQQNDLRFRYLHERCKTPIEYQRRCPVCKVEVPPEEIVWGYEYQPGSYVVLKEEDFARLPGEATKTIDILDFVELAEVDPVFFEKSYYLEPAPGGEKAYALLKRAMRETGKIAIARTVIRTKESLCALRVGHGVVMMVTMYYPDEIRAAAELPGALREVPLDEREVEMAVALVANLSGHFEPAKYTDRYREELRKLIAAKVEGKEIYTPPEPEKGKVIDLMEALRASLAATEKEKAKAGREGEPAGAGAGAGDRRRGAR